VIKMKCLIKTTTFKNAIKALNAVVDETTVTADAYGLHFCAVDPSHVAMIKIELPKESFFQYECEGETFGMDIEKLNNVLNIVKDDTLNFSVFNGRMFFRFDNIQRTMNVIEPDTILNFPNVNIDDIIFSIQIEQLMVAMKAGQKICNSFRFEAKDKTTCIFFSDDTDECEICLETKDLSVLSDTSVEFPVDFFTSMIKTIAAKTPIEIYLSSNMPLLMSFGFDEYSQATYMLAPIIHED